MKILKILRQISENIRDIEFGELNKMSILRDCLKCEIVLSARLSYVWGLRVVLSYCHIEVRQ